MRKLVATIAVAAVLVGLGPLVSSANEAARSGGRLSADLAGALETASADTGFLVFVQGVTPTAARDAVKAAGLTSVGELRSIGAPIAIGTSSQIRDLVAQPGVRYVERDRQLTQTLDTSRVAIRATEAAAPGSPYAAFDGSGQTIAIVDSGVDGTHPMFQLDGASKVVKNLKVACVNHIPGITIDALMHELGLPLRDTDLDACPSRATGDGADDEPLIVDMTDAGNDTDSPSLGGHGTHVAGILGGVQVTTEEATPRTFSGVATGAKIVSISQGASLTIYAENTAFDWIVRHHADPCGAGDLVACPPITVVNSSFGSVGDWDPDSATTALQRKLVEAGVTMVWANGNSGGDGTDNLSSNDGTAQIPGVISVANYDDGDSGTRDGSLDDTSSRGLASDPLTWPDVSAPGTSITSACRPYLTICATGIEADTNYGTISGTSMASPHVAGVVAILQEAALARPAPNNVLLTPAEVEDVLEDTAYAFGTGYEADPNNATTGSSFDKGHGLVDVVNALNAIFGAAPTTPGTGGGGGGIECAPDAPLVTDAEGDASMFTLVDTGENVPTLDVTSVDVAGDPVARTLAVVFHIADLTAEEPDGATGISFEGTLTVGGESVDVDAGRSGEDVWFSAAGEDVTGAFDVDADTVTVVVPSELIGVTGVVNVTGMTDGISRRTYQPTPLGPLTDDWSGACPQAVDLGAAAPADFTASAGSPATWSGEPTTAAADPTGQLGSVTVQGSYSDAHTVAVVVPAAPTPTKHGKGKGKGKNVEPVPAPAPITITFDVSCDGAFDDYDITLTGPDGKLAGAGTGENGGPGSSAEGGCVEQIVVPNAQPGTYTATVTAFATVAGTYTATITIS